MRRSGLIDFVVFGGFVGRIRVKIVVELEGKRSLKRFNRVAEKRSNLESREQWGDGDC